MKKVSIPSRLAILLQLCLLIYCSVILLTSHTEVIKSALLFKMNKIDLPNLDSPDVLCILIHDSDEG